VTEKPQIEVAVVLVVVAQALLHLEVQTVGMDTLVEMERQILEAVAEETLLVTLVVDAVETAALELLLFVI
jgi:hypothetical protein